MATGGSKKVRVKMDAGTLHRLEALTRKGIADSGVCPEGQNARTPDDAQQELAVTLDADTALKLNAALRKQLVDVGALSARDNENIQRSHDKGGQT
jgi:hypothetical protein